MHTHTLMELTMDYYSSTSMYSSHMYSSTEKSTSSHLPTLRIQRVSTERRTTRTAKLTKYTCTYLDVQSHQEDQSWSICNKHISIWFLLLSVTHIKKYVENKCQSPPLTLRNMLVFDQYSFFLRFYIWSPQSWIFGPILVNATCN